VYSSLGMGVSLCIGVSLGMGVSEMCRSWAVHTHSHTQNSENEECAGSTSAR